MGHIAQAVIADVRAGIAQSTGGLDARTYLDVPQQSRGSLTQTLKTTALERTFLGRLFRRHRRT